jgi:ferrous iron transport protein A
MIPLSEAQLNQRLKIVKIEGECGSLERRLMELGLAIGSEVVVKDKSYGPIILEARGSKIAIGRGMASKIFVEISK